MKVSDIYKIEGNQIVLDKEYIRGIPEYKVILERTIPSKGDHDGRKKLEHWKIFMYIKITADMFCYPNLGGFNDKDTHEAACRESTLGINYKPDDEVKAAIVKFKEIQLAMLPVLKTIRTTLRATRLSDTICESIIKNMEKSIDTYNTKVEEAEKRGEVANIADGVIIVNGLMDQLGQVQKIANMIPKTQETLEKLEERLKKESSGDNIARGGKTVGNRADPK